MCSKECYNETIDWRGFCSANCEEKHGRSGKTLLKQAEKAKLLAKTEKKYKTMAEKKMAQKGLFGGLK